MDGNQRMITWSVARALIGGVLACNGCVQSQPISDADEPFPHDPDCEAQSKVALRPWVELHDILDTTRG